MKLLGTCTQQHERGTCKHRHGRAGERVHSDMKELGTCTQQHERVWNVYTATRESWECIHSNMGKLGTYTQWHERVGNVDIATWKGWERVHSDMTDLRTYTQQHESYEAANIDMKKLGTCTQCDKETIKSNQSGWHKERKLTIHVVIRTEDKPVRLS